MASHPHQADSADCDGCPNLRHYDNHPKKRCGLANEGLFVRLHFGVFSLYYELYNKITELDGTGELLSHYTNIKQESEEEEVRLTTQNEGTQMMLDEEIRK